jgi:hypothetical protein
VVAFTAKLEISTAAKQSLVLGEQSSTIKSTHQTSHPHHPQNAKIILAIFSYIGAQTNTQHI